MGVLVPSSKKKGNAGPSKKSKIPKALSSASASKKEANKGSGLTLQGTADMANDLSGIQGNARENLIKLAKGAVSAVTGLAADIKEATQGGVAKPKPEAKENAEVEPKKEQAPLATMPDPETQTTPIEAALAEVQQTEDEQTENQTSSTPAGPAVDNDNNNTPGPQNR